MLIKRVTFFDISFQGIPKTNRDKYDEVYNERDVKSRREEILTEELRQEFERKVEKERLEQGVNEKFRSIFSDESD